VFVFRVLKGARSTKNELVKKLKDATGPILKNFSRHGSWVNPRSSAELACLLGTSSATCRVRNNRSWVRVIKNHTDERFSNYGTVWRVGEFSSIQV